jgi:hypothetical protein
MTDNNANVFVSSMLRIDKRFKYYGSGSIANISLLKMIYKYACYSDTYVTLQKLDVIVSLLQQKDPDICMNTINATGSGFFPEDSPTVDIPDNASNTAPTVSANTITVSTTTYTFSASEFLVGFSDAEGDGSGNIVIKTLPGAGTLKLSGVAMIAGQVITQANIPNLTYTRNVDSAYGTSFTWSVFDDNQNPMQSAPATMTVTVLSNTENSTPIIGDNTIYPDNRAVTTLTLAMFTTDTTAPYSDPEGDLLAAIRIDDISLENSGVFKISGVPIVVGDIITRAQLSAGDFTHEGPDQDSVNSDVFSYSARDEGSLTWVQ